MFSCSYWSTHEAAVVAAVDTTHKVANQATNRPALCSTVLATNGETIEAAVCTAIKATIIAAHVKALEATIGAAHKVANKATNRPAFC
jgi:hypothetical protein